MTDRETTQFSGVAGRVLRGTMSFRSLASGLLLGFGLIVSNWVLIQAHAPTFTTPLNHVIFAFVVVRFVLNGQFGEWEGGIFSGAGGSWIDVIQVGVRYLALNFVWLLPMILVGLRPDMSPAMMSRKMIVLALLYLVASILTPPVMLIVAVSADSFAEVFSGRHWRELFSGRITDLLSVYATYTGGMVVAVMLSAPSLIIAFAMSWKLGTFVAALAFCFLLGMSLDLLGRLCGFYALGDFAALGPAIGELPSPAPIPTRPAAMPAPPPVSTPKQPPLMNAKQRVDQIMASFAQDPDAAIHALEDLRANYAANAQVAGALAICRQHRGETEVGLRRAAEALPLAFERGHSHLAADLFKHFKSHLSKLNLNREQILTVAGAAATKGDLSTAGEAYSLILAKDATEARAIEGLLQVAQRILREKDKPTVAIRVYRFLEQRCSGTPLAEKIRRGLEQAERRLVEHTLA